MQDQLGWPQPRGHGKEGHVQIRLALSATAVCNVGDREENSEQKKLEVIRAEHLNDAMQLPAVR